MLDKSVPHYHVMMHRRPGAPLPEVTLPAGYRFRLFTPGDEAHWARLEASVLEFPDAVDALLYFQEEYLPYERDLIRRCLFIVDTTERVVATATAWWSYTDQRRDPWIHWVAVDPARQGLGLGKAIIARVTHLLWEIEGDRDFYLHTQTWSHRAIGIYEKCGFVITDQPGLAGFDNTDYAKALALLRQIRSGK